MNDPSLNTALKWGVENSSTSATTTDGPRTELSADAVAALFGFGNKKSDGQHMADQMLVAINKDVTSENRVIALENFEMIIEKLDNANYMENGALWTPLIELLEDEDADVRSMAAKCCSVAVQNNLRTQERLLIVGAIPTLMRLATEDTDRNVRKKATTAISSAVRNFQAGLDEAVKHAPAELKPSEKLDAMDMESVDILIGKMRESI